MLSFFLKQSWIGIGDFLLNFFTTFGSVLGLQVTVTFGSVLVLQVTVGLHVDTGLQPATRWEPLQAHCCVTLSQTKKESNRRPSA